MRDRTAGLRTVLLVALGSARHRPRTLLGPLAAMTFAVTAVVIGGQVITGVDALPDPGAQRYAEADLVVASARTAEVHRPGGARPRKVTVPEPAGVPEAVIDELEDVAGVATVVPDWASQGLLTSHDEPVLAQRGDTTVIRSWTATTLAGSRLVDGGPPTGSDQVAVPHETGVAVGDRLVLATPDGATPVTVSGLVADGRPEAETVVLVADSKARSLADGRAAAVGLLAADPAEIPTAAAAVRRTVAELQTSGVPLRVLTGDERVRAETDRMQQGEEDASALAGLLLGASVFVALFTVASTFALATGQRRKEFALLRLVGSMPRHIRAMVVCEALPVSIAGGVLGALIGPLLAPVLVSRLADTGFAPQGLAAGPARGPQLVAAGVAVGVGLLGSWGSARRASKARPVHALADAGVERGRVGVVRFVLGVVMIAGGLVTLLVTPSAGEVVAAVAMLVSWLLIGGLVLIAPLLMPGLAAGLLWLLRMPLRLVGVDPASALLAGSGARLAVRRTTGTAVPALVVVGLAASMFGIVVAIFGVFAAAEERMITADAVVLPGPAGSLSERVADEVGAVEGVSVTTPIRVTSLLAGPAADEWVHGAWSVEPAQLDRTTHFEVEAGSLAALRTGAIALDPELAGALGVQVDDVVTINGADGRPERVRLVAVVRLPDMVRALLPRRDDDGLVDRVLVSYDDGLSQTQRHDAETEVAAVAAAAGAHTSDAGESIEASAAAQEATNRIALRLILGIAVVLAVVGTANSVLMSVSDRRRDVAVLRLLGGDRRHVLAWTLAESLAGTLAAALLGLGVGVLTTGVVGGKLGGPLVTWPGYEVPVVTGVVLTAAALAALLAGLSLTRTSALDASRPSG